MKKFIFLSAVLITGLSQAQSPDFENQPVVSWKFKITAPIISSPVISDGLVFFGGLDSTLYALDVAKGSLKWKQKTNGEIRSTVTVANGRVYLLGGNGVLSCFDSQAGTVVWRIVFDNTALFLGERRYDFADYYHSSPIIHDNSLYFGSGNGRINAVNAQTGEVIWTFRAGDIVHSTPVVVRDLIYFGGFDGNLYALNRTTGDLEWKFKTVGHQFFPDGEAQGSPVAGNGSIFFGSRDYNVYAVDARGGYARWNRKFNNGWALSNTLADTVLYVGTSDDRVLVALDARTGAELWKLDVKFNIFGNCALTRSMVYAGTIWGKLYGVDRKTGAIRWVFDTDGYKANHLKYFKPDDSFRDDIGKILKAAPLWIAAEYSMGGMFSTPAISEDRMVVTTTEGMVYGLGRR
jgi:outer membrane protein assembly factor BamB